MGDPILEMLGRLRQRPNLWIGEHSVDALRRYLNGYAEAIRENTNLDITRYSDFIEGLYAKYGRGGGGHSWAWVLTQAAGGDAPGLDLFFTELDAFQQKAVS